MSFRKAVLHALGIRQQAEETPIIADSRNMSLDAISRIKKIKLSVDIDTHLVPYLRSCNGVIIAWCLVNYVSNRSCIEAYTFSYTSFRSLTTQLLDIQAEWRIQIELHVTILATNEYSTITMKSAIKKFNTQCEFSKYYISSFRQFENAIVKRTCNKYFITYVKFYVIK